jgi:hypothetical protein
MTRESGRRAPIRPAHGAWHARQAGTTLSPSALDALLLTAKIEDDRPLIDRDRARPTAPRILLHISISTRSVMKARAHEWKQ